jgi:ribosomal protein L29
MSKAFKALKDLSQEEIVKRIDNIRMDIIKGRVTASKGGKVKMRELKRTLARLLMLQAQSKSKGVEDKK